MCVCVWVGVVLLVERGVTEREFTVDWGNFGEGLERSGAKRSRAERSKGLTGDSHTLLVRGTGSDGKGIYRG